MEKRIELEKRGKIPANIKELILDNCRSTQIVGLTEEFCNLETLSLINVGLTNLKGFPKLPNLKKLELSDNRIPGGLNFLSGSPKLTTLNLSGNKIATLDALEPLKEFKNLKQIDLYNCEVTSAENYREKVYTLVPGLDYLDGFDRNEKEKEDTDEENGTHGNKFDDDSDDLDDEEEDEDEDEDEEEEDEDDDDEEEDAKVGLAYLQNSIDEESEGEDYDPEGANESDVDIEDDADEDADKPRGQKRKIENDED